MDPVTAKFLSEDSLSQRLLELWERTGDENLSQLAKGKPAAGQRPPESEQERMDSVSSALMNCYKNTGDAQVFTLLYELNKDSFLRAIQGKMRRGFTQVDSQDVLQEVFLNIYRYPRRFLFERADSFRNWGHRIARNTLLKALKGQARLDKVTPLDEDMGFREDVKIRDPFCSARDAEAAALVDFTYLVYLNLYLKQFLRLSPKEQRALRMVEVEGCSYKDTAHALGIRLENLKMVIFRGRRKIFRRLSHTFQELGTQALPTLPDADLPEPVPSKNSSTLFASSSPAKLHEVNQSS